MKKIKILQSITLVVMIALVACDSAPEVREIPTGNKEESAVQKDKIEILAENKAEVSMKIEGMVCAMGCAAKIEEEVANLKGVGLSKVDYESETANFEFDRTVVSSEEIAELIGKINDGEYKATIAIPTKEESDEKAPTTIDNEADSIVNVNNKKASVALQEEGIAAVRSKVQS